MTICKKKNLNIRQLTMVAMMVAVIAIMAQITIPIGLVPFTLQTAGMIIAVIVLKPQESTLAMLVYVLLGAIGLPIFAGFKGGLGVLVGPTGGFLFGFIIGTFVGSRFLIQKYSFRRAALASFLSILISFICGAAYFALAMGYNIKEALAITVLPFLPFDIIKLAIFIPIAHKIRERLQTTVN